MTDRANARQRSVFQALSFGIAGVAALLSFFLPWLTLYPLGSEAITWRGLQIALGNDPLSISGYPLLFVTLGASALTVLVAILAFRRRISWIILLALVILASVGLWQCRQAFEHLMIEYGAPYRLATSGYRVAPGLWLVVAGLSAACLVSLAYLIGESVRWLIRARQAHPPGYYSRRVRRVWRAVRIPLGVGLLLAGVLAFLDWNAARSIHPVWSPDGQAIAFESDRDAKRDQNDIYTIDIESGEVQRLTYHPRYDGSVAWSPDGTQLAFVSNRDGLTSLYLVDSSGEKLRHLIDPPQGVWSPVWDSSGSMIYYSTVGQGRSRTHAVDVETGSSSPMPDQIPWNRGHVLSASHQRAVFISFHEGERDFYVCNIETGDLHRLHIDLEWAGGPAWSYDGQQIAFMAWEDDSRSIYVVNVDGSGLRRLTDDRGHDYRPAWAPDGQSIAFVSNRSGRDEVYLIGIDGTRMQRLTHSRRIPWLPAWAWVWW